MGRARQLPAQLAAQSFGINQTDVALRRRVAVGAGVSVEFRAEVFNLFTHPMFGGPFAPHTFWGRCAETPCTGKQNGSFGRVMDGATLNQGPGGGGLQGG